MQNFGDMVEGSHFYLLDICDHKFRKLFEAAFENKCGFKRNDNFISVCVLNIYDATT